MASGAQDDPQAIQLRIQSIGQLFHTLDPLPFRERDLDSGVEEYVVGWARELSAAHPIEILIHLPPAEAMRDEAGHIQEAVRNYFAYRAEVTGWELRELFRVGRTSLAIGISVLVACVVASRFSRDLLGANYLGRVFNEGLIILGWVANWRPIEILLYDWWPIARRRRLYRRLAGANVGIVESEGSGLT